MTTMELNATLLKTTEPYPLEELNKRVDQAEKNYAAGHYTNSSEVHKEITNLLDSLSMP